MRKSGLLFCPALVVLCSLAGAQATAKLPLEGVVVDPAGAPVPHAEVLIFNEGIGVAQTQTDLDGKFTFSAVPHEYLVVVRAAGFWNLQSGSSPFRAGSLTSFTLQPTSAPQDGTGVSPTATEAGRTLSTKDLLRGTPVQEQAARTPWDFGVLAQGGFGTEDRSDYKFFLLGGHAGKVLTSQLGPGLLRGTFEYAVEVFPFWQSYTPHFQKLACTADPPAAVGTYSCSQPYTVGGTYTGVSITPIILRWNLTHGARWMPWIQGAGGVIWTDHKYPAVGNLNPLDTASNGPHGDTSVWNFTPQFGIGTHYFLKPRQSLDLSVNAVHISSASLGDKNPGVNASVQFAVGYSWWK